MCKWFEDGLDEDIKLLVGILELKEFVVLVDRAHKAEELSKEKEKPILKPKIQEKGSRMQATSVGSVTDNKPDCQRCGRRHFGECRAKDRACFKCGSFKHFIHDCPEISEQEKVQNVQPSNTATRLRPHCNLGNTSGSHGRRKGSAMRFKARAPTSAYAIHACEEASTPNVINGTFSNFDTNVIALIDPGSTHSYVCTNLVTRKNLLVQSTEFMVKVSNPLGQHVLVDKVCKNCPLMTKGYNFLADLMLLSFDEFDVILAMSAQKYVRKGCDDYLAYVLDSKMSELKLESVQVVCEYSDVFLNELPGLPPIREVEFAIELVPGTSPISVTPYRMDLTELKELKDGVLLDLIFHLGEGDVITYASGQLKSYKKNYPTHDLELAAILVMISEWKWDRVTMDFILGLPLSPSKKDVIWVIVDRLTKSAHFIPVITDFSLKRLVLLYVSEIVRLHGVPVFIISDRDLRFTSRF
ncbi:uncharacterized protein LOC128036142 [Gossypium raimondii]|uniref:uncharacterized protein LOC128036142 n=1 Tax=Gossypium raimondii TaxID=29730 RepID=UPI00227D0B1E|nr:uncharacterized protein LOC128036142 [Gossypium raimondii]